MVIRIRYFSATLLCITRLSNLSIIRSISGGFARVILLVFILSGPLFAVIAPTHLLRVNQPDGSPVYLYLKGDEWQHWYETPDGYSVTKNAEERWVFATGVHDGALVPGDLSAEDPKAAAKLEARGIEKQLKPVRTVMRSTPSWPGVSGKRSKPFAVPVILIDFPDMPKQVKKQEFESMMNQRNYRSTGSFNDYFEEASYGQFTTSATVAGWFTSEHEHAYYSESQPLAHQLELVRQAVDTAETQGFDWSQFDNDEDGNVDVVMVVHSGHGAEEGDDANIWSFSGELNWESLDVTYDDVKINRFTIQPEKYGNSQSDIGVFVHEFGHALGLPDLYDTDNSSEGIGVWGVMGSGAWGGDNFSPEKPTHPCAWSKWELGWLTPTIIDTVTHDLELAPVENSPVTYQIDNSLDDSEYFLLTNRQRTGFDGRLPEEGLLIWHIDEEKTGSWPASNDVNSSEPHYGVGLEQADGRFDLEGGENRGDTGDPFPGRSNNVIFDAYSTPGSASYYSEPSYVTVHDISRLDSLMQVDVWLPERGAPYLIFESYSIQFTVDDGDELLNPGERALMQIVLSNLEGAAVAANVVGEASAEDSDITFIRSSVRFSDIDPGASGVNMTDPIEFSVAEDAVPHTIPVTFRVTVGDDPYEFQLTEVVHFEVTLNQAGFPFSTSDLIKTAPTIFDIDGDGENEVVAGSDDFTLYAVGSGGDLKWSFATGYKIRSTPAIGDVNRDGNLELVFGSVDKNLYVLGPDGSLLTQVTLDGFPMSTPALKDLDGDNDLEIIFGDNTGLLHVLHHDGTEVEPFPLGIEEPLMTAPAVGDIDGDGTIEIAVGTWSNNVHVFRQDGSMQAGFPFGTEGKINTDPALADLDRDGKLELIVGSDDDRLYVIDFAGNLVFSCQTEGDIRGSPTVDDVDGDGAPEVFFGSNDRKLYGIDSRGNDLPGWPYQAPGMMQSAPVFFDLDSDGVAEIISADADGRIVALRIDGTVLNNFPVVVEAPVEASFSVGDLDGDADAEIAVGSSSEISVIDVKARSSQAYHWAMYRGNPHRTGFLGDFKLATHEQEAAVPLEFTVFPNFPNPFNDATTITYQIPERTLMTVEVYNLMGQLVSRLFQGVQTQGLHRVTWDSKGGGNRAASSGIYLLRIRGGGKVRVQKITLLR